jgi:hypothetical protein
MDVAVFARGPSGEEADERVLYLERHRFDADRTTLTLTVDEQPYEAGVDPYNKLVDRISQDNRRRISLD